MSRSSRSTASLALALALAATAASAQLGGAPPAATVGAVTVNGSTASTSVVAGSLQLDLAVSFEQVVGLTPASLGISARVISASELVGRLGSQVSLASGLPLLVRIEPPADGGLSFSGVASIDVHTHNLSFTANSPLRLYKAPLGGTFVDVTESMGMGSYRARGSTGGFSEFLILVDLRPAASAVTAKLDYLDALVAAYASAMSPELAAALGDQVDAIRAAWTAGNTLGAVDQVNAFSAAVQAVAGNPLPNVWRSSRDLTNVAGELRAAAATLRFSLNLAAS